MTDEPTQDELDDAIIEDTVHCDMCGRPWVLGGSGDGVIVQLPRGHGDPNPRMAALKLCIDCAGFVARCFEAEVDGIDQCEHGVITGDWCDECHSDFMEDAGQ